MFKFTGQVKKAKKMRGFLKNPAHKLAANFRAVYNMSISPNLCLYFAES